MSYEFIESPNQSGRKGNQVAGLIAHFTAGGEMNGTVRYMCNKVRVPKAQQGKTGPGYVTINGITYYNARASAHYITGRDGRTVMLVPENMSAWHAGSNNTKPTLNGRGNLNLWTIGHEICNWGPLRKVGDKFFTNAANWSHPYVGPEPVSVPRTMPKELSAGYKLGDGALAFPEHTIEWWEPYTEEQIKATITLWTEIVNRYNLHVKDIAGHEDVDPTRKCDPGAAFSWDDILGEVFKSPSEPKKSDLLYPSAKEIDSVAIDTADIESSVEVDMAERMFDDNRAKPKKGICSSLLSLLLK